jgi:hypothetical protein
MEVPRVGRKWSMAVAAALMGMSLILVRASTFLVASGLAGTNMLIRPVPNCQLDRGEHRVQRHGVSLARRLQAH